MFQPGWVFKLSSLWGPSYTRCDTTVERLYADRLCKYTVRYSNISPGLVYIIVLLVVPNEPHVHNEHNMGEIIIQNHDCDSSNAALTIIITYTTKQNSILHSNSWTICIKCFWLLLLRRISFIFIPDSQLHIFQTITYQIFLLFSVELHDHNNL